MYIYQVKDVFKDANPGKNITYEFDDKCHRKVEFLYLDGVPNTHHHIVYHKIKVTVEGQMPLYIPIDPHREEVTHEEALKKVNK